MQDNSILHLKKWLLQLFFCFLAFFVFAGLSPVHASDTHYQRENGYITIIINEDGNYVSDYTVNAYRSSQGAVNDTINYYTSHSGGSYEIPLNANTSTQTYADSAVGMQKRPDDPEVYKEDERQYRMRFDIPFTAQPGYSIQTSTDWQYDMGQGSAWATSNTISCDMTTNANGMTNWAAGFEGMFLHGVVTVNFVANHYYVSYNPNGGSGSMPNSTHTVSKWGPLNYNGGDISKYYTVSLNPTGGWVSPSSIQSRCAFLGWASTSAGPVAYSNGQSVKDLTTIDGATVPLYAKWGPAVLDPLPTPSRTGYLFLGWYNAANGGTQYFGGESVTSDMTLYAHWEPIKYWLQFDPNSTHGPGTVTGTMPTIQLTYDQPINLPINQYYKTTVSNKEYEGGPVVTKTSTFLGWSQTPTSLMPSYTDGQSVVNLTATNNDTITFYAVWDDSPKFIIVDFPNRYFSVAEAQAGKITVDDLLSTVTAYDRETYPLAKGSNPGITIPTYDASTFTSVTGDATIPVQYYLRDSWGHEAWLNIIVRITSVEPNFEYSEEYIRGISGKYWKDENGNFVDKDSGGLDDNSVWRTNPAYTKQLDDALADDNTNTKTYEFTPEDLETIRNNVASGGIGANNLDEQIKNGDFDK